MDKLTLASWQNRCKSAADTILDEYSKEFQLNLPVPIGDVIKSQVGDVQIFVTTDYAFPTGVSALATKDLIDGWTILVNGHDAKVHQRFSAAHELAHIAVIPNPGRKVFCSTDKYSWDEKLCDRFAGHILMPEIFVREMYKINPFPHLEDIAKIFEVSRQVAEIELRRLGLPFSWKFGQT